MSRVARLQTHDVEAGESANNGQPRSRLPASCLDLVAVTIFLKGY
jgi:hypothetical protein